MLQSHDALSCPTVDWQVLRPWRPRRPAPMLGPMLIDHRGSEVLPRTECLRLLAVAAAAGAVGRLAAVADPEAAPLLRPVNFAYDDGQVLLQMSSGTMAEHLDGRLVAFETDGIDSSPGLGGHGAIGWSVLVRGLALRVHGGREGLGTPETSHHLPHALVPVAGELLYTIRPDVVSGRRFVLREADATSVVRR
jgi:hypothetical protein